MARKPKALPAIPADAIYQIRMLRPRVVNTIKTNVGDLVDVFANDAARFVRDKHAEYDPPLDVQQAALNSAAAK